MANDWENSQKALQPLLQLILKFIYDEPTSKMVLNTSILWYRKTHTFPLAKQLIF